MEEQKLINFFGKKIEEFIVFWEDEDYLLAEDFKIRVDKIWIKFDTEIIEIIPLTETDEIEVNTISIKENNFGYPYHKKINKFSNLKLGQSWIGINGNGYYDILILGFEGIQPNLIILSESSSLKLFSVTRI